MTSVRTSSNKRHINLRKHQLFYNDTLPSNTFIIRDVCNDNACFFRAIANQLFYRSRYNKARMIFSNNNRIETKNIQQV